MMEPPFHGFDVGAAVKIHVVVFRDSHIHSVTANTVMADQNFKLRLEISPENIRAFAGEYPHISFPVILQMIKNVCKHNIQRTGFPREVMADL
jgi:hypothetical protein